MLFIQLYLNHPINPGFVLNIRNNIDIIYVLKRQNTVEDDLSYLVLLNLLLTCMVR